MIKRTMGRILLSLLVITGLAGTLNSSTISTKERKSATSLLKDSKAGILDAVRGLHTEQLNFRKDINGPSVRECILQAATNEHQLWKQLQSTLKKQANPEMRKQIVLTDDQLLQKAEKGNFATTVLPAGILYDYATVEQAITAFRKERTEHLKYMKMTTEDLRNHVLHTPSGWIDCYQLCLVMAADCAHLEKVINGLKQDPRFPE